MYQLECFNGLLKIQLRQELTNVFSKWSHSSHAIGSMSPNSEVIVGKQLDTLICIFLVGVIRKQLLPRGSYNFVVNKKKILYNGCYHFSMYICCLKKIKSFAATALRFLFVCLFVCLFVFCLFVFF